MFNRKKKSKWNDNPYDFFDGNYELVNKEIPSVDFTKPSIVWNIYNNTDKTQYLINRTPKRRRMLIYSKKHYLRFMLNVHLFNKYFKHKI